MPPDSEPLERFRAVLGDLERGKKARFTRRDFELTVKHISFFSIGELVEARRTKHFKLDPGIAERAAEASSRVFRVLQDARAAGVEMYPMAITWFIQLNDDRLGTYAACREMVDLLLSMYPTALCVTAKTVSALLRKVAFDGNYTAFCKLLHEAMAYLMNLYVAAVTEAAPAASEDLPGHPRSTTFVADLAVPLWADLKDHKLIRSRDLRESDLDPLESAEDPVEAVRGLVSSQTAPSLADTYRPDQPPGCNPPTRKVLQILAMSLVGLRSSSTGLDSKHYAWDTVVQSLRGNRAINLFLKDAEYREDWTEVQGLIALQERLGAKSSKELRTTLVGYFLRTRQYDRAIEILRKMVKDKEISSVLGSVLMDAILGHGSGADSESAVERAKRIFGAFAELGIAVDLQHWTKTIQHFADQGDLRSVDELLEAFPFPLDDVLISLVVHTYARCGEFGQFVRYLKTLPRDRLTSSELWAAVFVCLIRHVRATDKKDYADTLFALACAVLDAVPLHPYSMPAGLRDVPLAGMPPPKPQMGLVIILFDTMRYATGPQLAVLEGKGRKFLAQNGYGEATGLDALGMLELVQRSLVLERVKHPRSD
ncbi:hypothetical protein DFJ74DRAFT_708191 [Hyaloraphidium curvatum]|nr:hypothetical protein DFJ74DRAFT_708191 [Hyaloraphidium curvatum]